MTVLLEVDALRAGYQGSVVLHDVDFTVREGQAVALLGRNGVGKTTFLATVMGLLKPISGSGGCRAASWPGAGQRGRAWRAWPSSPRAVACSPT